MCKSLRHDLNNAKGFYLFLLSSIFSLFFFLVAVGLFLFFAASDAATVAAAGADDAGAADNATAAAAAAAVDAADDDAAAAEAALQYAGIRNRDSWTADRCATIYQCATLTPKARVIKYIPEVQADIIYILYTSLLLF